MALGYWREHDPARHRILVLEHGYHGDTIGAMSVGARGVFNSAYEPLLFDVGTIPFPVPGGEQASLDALEQACAAGAAAFIVEPLVLGAGGMHFYAPSMLREMRAICARHGVLFVADEVMTGWGRTGTLLACEQAGVVPDILCLSKGLTGGAVPLAVTMATEPIFQAHYGPDRGKMFFHSSSYTANPIACAAARANLAIWAEEPVAERIELLGKRQQARLDALSGLRNVRSCRRSGTITALEIAGRTATRPRSLHACWRISGTGPAPQAARQHGLRDAALLHRRRRPRPHLRRHRRGLRSSLTDRLASVTVKRPSARHRPVYETGAPVQ